MIVNQMQMGGYFIDADPKHFDRILHFLRTGKLRFKGVEEPEKVLLKDSLEFFFRIAPILRWDSVHSEADVT